MQISYAIEAEDFVAFNLNYMKNDPNAQKRVRVTQAVGVAVIALAVLAFSVMVGVQLSVIGLGVIAAVLYAFYIPRSIKTSVRKSVDRVLKSGIKTAVGEKTLAIEADKLHLTGSGEDSFYDYGKINSIVTDEAHYFIYTGDLEALILPFRAFSDEADRNAFYSTLCDKVTEAGGSIG